MEDIKLLLVGNPNAGKSTLFNALTGAHAKVGNWHGVTVGVLEKAATFSFGKATVCDLPGIYSAEGVSMEEKLALDYFYENSRHALLFVAECATLLRALPLFCTLAKTRARVALALTKRKAFERAGGRVDVQALSSFLGVPVFFAEGKTCKNQVEKVLRRSPRTYRFPPTAERGELPKECYLPRKEGLSKVDKLLTNGWFCLPFFLVLLFTAFFLTFAPNQLGDICKGKIEWFFCDFLGKKAQKISSPVLYSLVKEGVLESVGGVLSFLPQIALLTLFLTLLEESGLLSRLAVLLDGALSKIGLNGRAVFTLLMGFGCTAVAVSTTRGLDDKRIQRRALLSLPYIPCSAKLPVFLTLSSSFFHNQCLSVALLYIAGVGLSLVVSYFLKDKTPPPFVLELAPLQLPRPIFVAKSLFFQLKQFIIKTATVILAFFLASWLLSSFTFSFRFCEEEESMLAILCGGLKYLFAPVGMCDWRIAYAALSGLIAKENVAGTISLFFGTFPYSAASAFAFAVFVLTCSPCVSAMSATAREVGVKRALKYAALQTLSALLLCYLAYFVARGGGIYLLFLLLPVLVAICLRKNRREKIYRNRKLHSFRFHR